MIVELFGPAGSGKSTFTVALAHALRVRGICVDVIASSRPKEDVQTSGGPLNGVYYTGRWATGLVIAGWLGLVGATIAKQASELLTMFPPVAPLWRMRLYRYLVELYRKRNAPRSSSEVVVFDQGFVQAICSLVMLSNCETPDIVGALRLVPAADLSVFVETSRDTIAQRLSARGQQQGRLRQALELEAAKHERCTSLFYELYRQLGVDGRQVLRVDNTDRASLERGIRIASDLIARLLQEESPGLWSEPNAI